MCRVLVHFGVRRHGSPEAPHRLFYVSVCLYFSFFVYKYEVRTCRRERTGDKTSIYAGDRARKNENAHAAPPKEQPEKKKGSFFGDFRLKG